MKKVMVFGTFDLLHKGHKSFLKQAKKNGDYLIALVARDVNVIILKKRELHESENTRLEKISKLSYVDEAILGNKRINMGPIKRINPDIICLGYDQTYFLDKLKKFLDESDLHIKVIRLEPHKPYKYKSQIKRAKKKVINSQRKI